MKLRPYQLCRWCDRATTCRWPRAALWLYPAANVLLFVLFSLLGLFRVILPLLLMGNAVVALYLLHRHHAFGAIYQRKPRPKDAQCETILIDASLIGQGTRLRAAAQPIDVSDSVTLRLGSGALLMGAAMVLTADALPRPDRAAVLSAVQSLNIKPGRMRSHSPVLSRETHQNVTIVTVRDGMSNRRYYTGPAEEVAACCTSIWEGHTRALTDHDHTRIADTARYIAQANCRVTAWATALEGEEPTFLGMAGVGEEVDLNAVEEVAALRGMGLTVMLDPGIQPDTDLDSLRALLDLPDHHARPDLHMSPRTVNSTALGIVRRTGDSLLEPVNMLRQRFRTIEDTLRHFGVLMGLPMVLSLLFGAWPAALLTAAVMLYTAIALGVDLSSPAPRWQTLLGIGVAALLAKAFLLTQTGTLALMGGGVITAAAAVICAARLCGSAFTFKGNGWKRTLPILLAGGLYVLGTVLAGLSAGSAMLLPLAFSALIAAAIVLLIRFEQMIFR